MSGSVTGPPARPEEPGEDPAVDPAEQYRVPRSARGPAAAVVALVVLVASGALLYDVAAVRTGHRAGAWRVRIADELATRHLDSAWVFAAAAVAAVLGCWLLWLAVTPGNGRWLALRQAPGALIERAGVAAVLEARALELTMVAAAKVRVSHRQATVTLFGSADAAQADAELAGELERIGLVRPLRLRVRLRPAKHRPHMH
ncbi:hypothetical protein P3T36_001634 [Kitasatospora sp. MAP12-15]|uniref:DUF6286 domain-containing protein n=1 Tax=unclassified Kitasatospora TaxID=2633591 RepID=UPI002474D174|nr:DUF6286 domain-containing protein [Kitasatospora sp. MAP12-44]MDH6113487.1 hypothetical protein [Kitasatospora sp. MAP12-44]